MMILNEKLTQSKPKVFLGGTVDSKWRDKLIPLLQINYFNPLVPNWTEECMKEEVRQKGICEYHLYVITPNMTGVFSIAEVVDDSNKCPKKTIFVYLNEDVSKNGDISTFSPSQIKSLDQVCNVITHNGGKCFKSLDEVAKYLNSKM